MHVCVGMWVDREAVTVGVKQGELLTATAADQIILSWTAFVQKVQKGSCIQDIFWI